MFDGNLIVGQSGGPTAAINATLCGVIEGALRNDFEGKIYGMANGVEGLLEEKIIDLGQRFDTVESRDLLVHSPSAYLGSCRFKLSSQGEDVYDRIFRVLEEYNIKYFIYIGGNDSMDTILRLSRQASKRGVDVYFIGAPKTVDNDLACTDHTPGYGSAAKFIATAVREMACDTMAYDLESVLIVEIMGRNAGWLTAASALARGEAISAPDLIYLPERPFYIDRFLKDVKRKVDNQKVVIVAVSEGVRDENGNYICQDLASGAVDAFGHKYLSGCGKVLENAVRMNLGVKARAVELSMLQRCAAHLASETDIMESRMIGRDATYAVLSGVTGHMIGFRREYSAEYKIATTQVDLSGVANVEKIIPDDWINKDGNDVTQSFISYVRPLIQGERYPVYEEGLPKYVVTI